MPQLCPHPSAWPSPSAFPHCLRGSRELGGLPWGQLSACKQHRQGRLGEGGTGTQETSERHQGPKWQRGTMLLLRAGMAIIAL